MFISRSSPCQSAAAYVLDEIMRSPNKNFALNSSDPRRIIILLPVICLTVQSPLREDVLIFNVLLKMPNV